MTNLSGLIITISSWSTLIADIFIGIFILSLIFKGNDFSKSLNGFIYQYALILSFAISLIALAGSILFSSVIGFAPCELCWIQRIFIFPQAIIFAIALVKRDKNIFSYTLPLSIVGGLVALYQTYTLFGGSGFTACTAVNAACSKIFFMEFGFITIPTMSLTAFVLLTLVALVAVRSAKSSI